jgi:hypothetical protein
MCVFFPANVESNHDGADRVGAVFGCMDLANTETNDCLAKRRSVSVVILERKADIYEKSGGKREGVSC